MKSNWLYYTNQNLKIASFSYDKKNLISCIANHFCFCKCRRKTNSVPRHRTLSNRILRCGRQPSNFLGGVRESQWQTNSVFAWRTKESAPCPIIAGSSTLAYIASSCLIERGCGKSLPFSELEQNTTWDLVEDIERLRHFLEVDTWVVFGGSWGSTLGLTYAIQHPESVKGLILRGIFLCRPKEIQWYYQNGADQIYPDEWERYSAPSSLQKETTLYKPITINSRQPT